jgi:ATP-dependent Clp protease ATP-binding subunit ClpA
LSHRAIDQAFRRYEEGSRLPEAVRRKPYSVTLLDEIEKAHRDVFNVLLQFFDGGRLTDGQRHTVDFKNTVIIMTSKIVSDKIQQMTEEAEGNGLASSRASVCSFLLPKSGRMATST